MVAKRQRKGHCAKCAVDSHMHELVLVAESGEVIPIGWAARSSRDQYFILPSSAPGTLLLKITPEQLQGDQC